MRRRRFSIIDDSGLIAIVDPDAYVSFVAEEWDFGQLETRFLEQMAERHLLIWETSIEETWLVQVNIGRAAVAGYRQLIGPIRVSQGRLLLTSFGGLSMAAQYADVALPEPHEMDQVIHIPSGEYRCRVVQVAPISLDFTPGRVRNRPDFILELIPADIHIPVWREIGWINLFKAEE